MNPATATDWRGISVAFIAGIAAAIMLAKGSAAAPTIQLELDLQLAQIGWIMSISNLATLLFGTLSGQLSARFGLPHMVKTGLAVMTVAALASLLADSFPSILTGRAIEGIGVVLLTVAAPAWIASMSSNEDRAMAMGVWALWLPVGSIIIMLLSPLLMASGGWRALWLFSAVASALAWLLIRTPKSTGSQQSSGEFDLTALKRKGPWLLALVFACFSFQFFSVFTFLPIYFTDQLGLSPWMILILMQLSFIVMGTFLDDTAMLVIVAPLYVPLVGALGFDLIWYGVLYTITTQIAYMTPPFGYNLFLMRAMAPPEITLRDIYASILPFVLVMVLALSLVMTFPEIALWLPDYVYGK